MKEGISEYDVLSKLLDSELIYNMYEYTLDPQERCAVIFLQEALLEKYNSKSPSIRTKWNEEKIECLKDIKALIDYQIKKNRIPEQYVNESRNLSSALSNGIELVKEKITKENLK